MSLYLLLLFIRNLTHIKIDFIASSHATWLDFEAIIHNLAKATKQILQKSTSRILEKTRLRAVKAKTIAEKFIWKKKKKAFLKKRMKIEEKSTKRFIRFVSFFFFCLVFSFFFRSNWHLYWRRFLFNVDSL